MPAPLTTLSTRVDSFDSVTKSPRDSPTPSAAAGVAETFTYPIKTNATKTNVITTTTTSSTRSGWSEFNSTNGAGGVPSPESSPRGSPITVKIQQHTNNYNIVNNIHIKLSGGTGDDDLTGGSTPQNPVLVPKPPETARPSSVKPAPANTAAATQSSHHNSTQQSQTARPNTAVAGSKTGSSSNPTPNPPSHKPSSSSSHASTPVPAPPPSLTPASGMPVGDKGTAVSHYAVGKTIGEGTFGKVKAGIHKLTGLPVAIKILEKERIVDLADVSRVKREVHILTRVRHPNVIRLFEVIDSPRHIFLIMEHCNGGELFDYIVAQGRVKEEQACKFFHQILNGTDYFHNKNIIHRDLKPENLLLDENSTVVKIVDFGLGNVVKGGKLLKTACGSPCYAAPEMVAGKRYVGPGCDMWSLGVILFALLCGYLPFEDANTARLYEKIMGGEYELPDFLSTDSKDLISKLLTTDPRKRFNAEQVRRHPWYARLSVPTDPAFTQAELDAPIVPGPQASGKRVKKTIAGHTVDDEAQIDADIIRHMVMLGYHPQQVQESVTSNRHDHFAATYHLLLIKKNLTAKAHSKSIPSPSPSSSSRTVVSSTPTGAPAVGAATNGVPPTVPRIPIGATHHGPQIPSHPIAQPTPPTNKQPHTAYPHHHHRTGTTPTPSSTTAPITTSSSARVQSAGPTRPSGAPVGSSAVGGVPIAHTHANTARPGTSYAKENSVNPAAHHTGVSSSQPPHAWNDAANTHGSGPNGPLGVGNGVNGGANVNAYMQHYHQQAQAAAAAAAMYGSNGGQAAQSYYRPGSSASVTRPSPPSSATNVTPQPPASSKPPVPTAGRAASRNSGAYPRAPSSQGQRGAGGRAGKMAGGVANGAPKPNVPQTLFVHGPLSDSISSPVTTTTNSGYPHSSPSTARTIAAAVGPATGRPMTSRITGSTGGVSHRLYFPPSERAAQELAMAAALGSSGAASRPTTGSGHRPQSSVGGPSASPSRPGTSASNTRRPPSGQRTQPRTTTYGNTNNSTAASSSRRHVERDDDLPIDESDWNTPLTSKSVHHPHTPSGSSSFNTQLSAMSFKPVRSIMDELQRVFHANGLTYTVLPPSGGTPVGPTSPLGAKHGFVPGVIGATSAATNLAPISISSLRPHPRSTDGGELSSSNQVIEVRSGSNRFQFHVAALGGASAGLASKLAADLDPSDHVPTGAGAGHAIRVKRVLGDAQTFREICAKLLPQLKL